MSDDTQAAIERLQATHAAIEEASVEIKEHTGDPEFPVYTMQVRGNAAQRLFHVTEQEMPSEWMHFIAAAHNDLPALLEYIEQLERMIFDGVRMVDVMGTPGAALLDPIRERVRSRLASQE